jgi:primosomal protein N' (replication factor Y)
MKYCRVVFPVPLRREFDYIIPPALEGRLVPGQRVRVPFGPRTATGFVYALADKVSLPPFVKLKEIISLVDETPLWDFATLFAAAEFISSSWGSLPGEVLDALMPSDLKPAPEDLTSAAEPPPVELFSQPPELTAKQNEVFIKLFSHFAVPGAKPALLYGDSLSGKTELSLRLLQKKLESGGQGLLLAPDISLTDRLIENIAARFAGVPVFCWHSRRTPAQRLKIWHTLVSGRPALVIGARSAALLPFKNLRLAVIDEEQDDTYKQEENRPHYHARDVLMSRSAREKFPVLLCSSAPSIETMRRAVDGDYELVRLKGSALFSPGQVKARFVPKKGMSSSVISDELKFGIETVLESGNQALLILNRIGFAVGWACLNCNYMVLCPKCGHAMAPNNAAGADRKLFCSRCGESLPPPEKCPLCGNMIFKPAGGGTERAVTELKKFFPKARVLRFDRDTLELKGGEGHTVDDAMTGAQADIVVGTRMLARGHYFPKLRLVAMLDADTELYGPDFRGAERTAQMLIQARGRLAASGGEFIIQTSRPREYAIAAALSGEYMDFAMHEFEERKALGYPPYSRIVRFISQSRDEDAAFCACEEAIAQVNAASAAAGMSQPADYDIAGPAPCHTRPADKVKRCHVLIKCKTAALVKRLVPVLEKKPAKGLTTKVVCDPYSFR